MNENNELISEEEKLEQLKLLKSEVFIKLKEAFIKEERLLKRFYDFCEEYTNFEYDEQGLNMEEADDVLRKANKIRDKVLNNVELDLMFIFEDVETNSLNSMMYMNVDVKEAKFKVILEVMEDSFKLEVL